VSFIATLCWCGGLLLSSVAIYFHQLWLLWLGAGVIGGIGLGLGYISPVSTLLRWFPDKRGMAAGMAIMGFGGGALVGAAGKRSDELLRRSGRQRGMAKHSGAGGDLCAVYARRYLWLSSAAHGLASFG
jgi:MFS family permease